MIIIINIYIINNIISLKIINNNSLYNINIKYNKQLLINYLTKIATYILKIKNTNDIIFLQKSKNIYEIFKNHDNYLTVKIFIDNKYYTLKLEILYRNIINYKFYFANYKSFSKIQITKEFKNIELVYYIPFYKNNKEIYTKIYHSNNKIKHSFDKINNNIKNKFTSIYKNFYIIIFYKKYKENINIKHFNTFLLHYYKFNYNIYIYNKITLIINPYGHRHYVYTHNYLSINYKF